MYNLCNAIIYGIDKYYIKHGDDKIFVHTENKTIDDIKSSIKHMKKMERKICDSINTVFLMV